MSTSIKGVCFDGLKYTKIGLIYLVIYPYVYKLDLLLLLCQNMYNILCFNTAINTFFGTTVLLVNKRTHSK